MAKFRKKPVVIEAEQYFLNGHWPLGVGRGPDETNELPYIQTLEGKLFCTDGDWIITGVKGERYPCKPDIFEATYEEVKDASTNN